MNNFDKITVNQGTVVVAVTLNRADFFLKIITDNNSFLSDYLILPKTLVYFDFFCDLCSEIFNGKEVGTVTSLHTDLFLDDY